MLLLAFDGYSSFLEQNQQRAIAVYVGKVPRLRSTRLCSSMTMTSEHHDRAVIFLDHDDSVEINGIECNRGEDSEADSKTQKTADGILKPFSFLRNKAGGVFWAQGAGVKSYLRNGHGKSTKSSATDNNKNIDSSSTLPPGLEQLNDLIIQAEYECTQDPYRGIGRLRQGQRNVQEQLSANEEGKDDIPMGSGLSLSETAEGEVASPTAATKLLSPLSSASTKADGLASRSGRKPSDSSVSPWDTCQWGILSMLETSFVVGEDSGTKECRTPSNFQPGDDSRPIQSFFSESLVQLEPDNPENLVKCLTESCCPSLLAWTKRRIDQDSKSQSQQNRRRRIGRKRGRSESDAGSGSLEVHLGQRPSGINYRCPCDRNPYCLASLGGVVNDILRERCDTAIAIEDDDDNDNANTVDNDSKKDDSRYVKRLISENGPPNRLRRWLDSDKPGRGKQEDIWEGNLSTKTLVFSDSEEAPDENHDEVVVVGTEVVETPTKSPTTADNSNKENNPVLMDIPNTNCVLLPVVDDGRDTCNLLAIAQETTKELNVSRRNPAVATAPLSSSSLPTKQALVVIKCTRLRSQSSNLPSYHEREDPGDIYFQTEEDEVINQYLNETNYSRETQEELDRLRISQDLDVAQIQGFVLAILERVRTNGRNGDEKMETLLSLDQYMKAIGEWNRSLLFVSPIKQECHLEGDKITIGLPPGIQNLGATCYLNTQLQCLAQIPAFLDGIFSWRVVNSNHNMNPVMTKLQKLLATMLVGGERKMSIQDFSDALGLEHHEQQDPNEFGRLLFDRMEESFQQCSDMGNGDCSGSRDLAHLLERIFRGTTTYATTCKKCGRTSARSEDFTDLNLPIVRRPLEEDKDFVGEGTGDGVKGDQNVRTKTRTKGLIDSALGRKSDSDVQYCFDKYATVEVLDGDNQYHCSNCDSKQDAERVLTLTKLPPVLNVQLSRYVFDRVKFVKKKLMDKVLLPKTLTISRQIDSPTDSAVQLKEKQYVLCAVMRHQGTSAYSGHYIAEAIDWTTGLWYEFNDETVKVLPKGPSCSYIPNTRRESSTRESDSVEREDDKMLVWNESQEEDDEMVTGSQDAYNMYYVDEDYLARNAVSAVVKRHKSLFSASANVESESGVLQEVVKERKNRYSVLSE